MADSLGTRSFIFYLCLSACGKRYKAAPERERRHLLAILSDVNMPVKGAKTGDEIHRQLAIIPDLTLDALYVNGYIE